MTELHQLYRDMQEAQLDRLLNDCLIDNDYNNLPVEEMIAIARMKEFNQILANKGVDYEQRKRIIIDKLDSRHFHY